MASSNVRGLIFDFGNVIYRFDLKRFTSGLSKLCGLDSEEIHQRVFEGSGVEWDYMAGNIDSSGFLDEVSRLCGHSFEEEPFIALFVDIFTPIEPTLELVKRVKPFYKLGLISDTSAWHFEHAIRHCEIFPLFDAVTLSYVERRLKPDRRMFQHCLDRLGLRPQECIFIDDRAPNTAGARAMGLQAITYRGHENLLEGLRARGVVV
jgi:epoxide hydrolase-like predicted phosphatase